MKVILLYFMKVPVNTTMLYYVIQVSVCVARETDIHIATAFHYCVHHPRMSLQTQTQCAYLTNTAWFLHLY
jgi:hypothetical protein